MIECNTLFSGVGLLEYGGSSNLIIIITIVVASIVLLIIAVIIAVLLCKRRKPGEKCKFVFLNKYASSISRDHAVCMTSKANLIFCTVG